MINVTGLLAAVNVFCGDLHLIFVCSCLLKKICLKKGEVRWEILSNTVIATLVTQSLPSYFLCRPFA